MAEGPGKSCALCGAPMQASAARCDYCGGVVQGGPLDPRPPSPGSGAPPFGPPPQGFGPPPRGFGPPPGGFGAPPPFGGPSAFSPPPAFAPPPVLIQAPVRRGGGAAAFVIVGVAVAVIGVIGAGAAVFLAAAPSGGSSYTSSFSVPAATAAPGSPVSVGVPIRGTFTPFLPSDPQGYPYVDHPLSVTTPGAFTVSLMSDDTSGYDPYIRIMQNGMQIAYNDDGGGGLNSQLTQVLGAGEYVVRVSKFGTGAVSRPVGYTLNVMGPPQAAPAAPSYPTPAPGYPTPTPGYPTPPPAQ